MARLSDSEINKIKSYPLVDYILDSDKNYKISHNLSNSSTTYLENKVSGSKIAISKKNGHFIFKDWKPPVAIKGEGSIIDFVMQYQNKSYGEALHYLKDVAKNRIPEKQVYNQVKNGIEEKAYFVSTDYFKYEKLKFTQYLNDRGITNKVINSPTFVNRVGQKKIDTKSGGYYYTTVFPMYKNISGDLIGLEQKNHAFTGSYKGSRKQEGFFKSNPLSKNPTLFISENPIDMLAHYSLHNNNNVRDILYLGTYGELGKERIKIINDYIKDREHRFKKFILGMDNDPAGLRFNINLMGNVDFKDSQEDLKFYIKADKEIAKMTIESKNLDILDDIEKELNFIANNKLKLTTNHELQYRNFNRSKLDEKHELSFLMNNRMLNYIPLEELVKKWKNSKFEVERSQGKDWCIDLENKLNIIRTKEPVFSYNNDSIGYILVNDQPLKVTMAIDKGNNSYKISLRNGEELGKHLNKLKLDPDKIKDLKLGQTVTVKTLMKSVWKNANKFKDNSLEK